MIRSGQDVAIEAARDLVHRAGRHVDIGAGSASAPPQLRVGAASASLTTPRMEMIAGAADVAAGEATITAGRIITTARELSQRVERFELTATRLVEKVRDAFRDATDLAQTRVGRARTIVKDLYALRARRTEIASTDDTSIDGRRVHLG
jgi:hypothetical protein